MPQIVTIGSGGDYSTVASWVASSDYSTDWGVGNKATGQITGIITEAVTINTATTPNGALLTAFPDEEYDGTNSATCAGLVSSGITLALRDNGLEVSFIFVETTNDNMIAIRLGAFEAVDTDLHDVGAKSGLLGNGGVAIETYASAAFTGNIERVITEGSGGFGLNLRNACTGTLDHITVIDAAANGSGFRDGIFSASATTTITNTLVLLASTAAGGAESFAGSYSASSDFNAGDDTTAPGSNSLDNRTTADLANYAGADFRTASGSALEAAGSGGGFIGAYLESSSGISLSVTLGSIDYASQNATVQLSGVVDVSATLGLINYSSNNAVVQLSGNVDIIATLGAISYTNQNTTVQLSGEINVNTTLGLISYESQSTVVQISGVIGLNATLGTIDYSSLNTLVEISGETNVNATLGSIDYSSQNPTIQLSGEIIANATLGLINYSSNNTVISITGGISLSTTLGQIDYSSQSTVITLQGEINIPVTLGQISYNSNNVIIGTGEQQIIGVITAGFAADLYSSEFEPDLYTAGFKPDVITAKFKT